MRRLVGARRRLRRVCTYGATAAALVALLIVASPDSGMLAGASRLAHTSGFAHASLLAHGRLAHAPEKLYGKQPAPGPAASSATVAPGCQGTTPLGLPGAWTCTFDDEFNGSTLDTNSWVPQVTAGSGYLNGATACYVDNPDTISVSGGYLNLSVRQVSPFTCPDGSDSFTTSYEAGMVSTYGLFDQTYGAFEVNAKLPPSVVAGLQETLWLYPQNAELRRVAGVGRDRLRRVLQRLPRPRCPLRPLLGLVDRSQRHLLRLPDQPERLQHLRRGLDADVDHRALQRHAVPGRLSDYGQRALRPAVLHRPDPGARHGHRRLRAERDPAAGHDAGRLGPGLGPGLLGEAAPPLRAGPVAGGGPPHRLTCNRLAA